jgi:8-amino-7-oxononanoate synthase
MNPLAWIDVELASLELQQLRRRLRTRDDAQTTRAVINGRTLVNFGSNDYLGLAADPRLSQAARDATVGEGWGSGASPLVTGYSTSHAQLAQKLADFENVEAALVFASGFAANAGTIAAIVGPGDVVYCDRKNHASLFDGCRLSRADVRVYPHADSASLASLLADSQKYRRRLIVTDGLFSMDGDLAPLPQLANLAERHDAMLLVDEAHATGVFGEHGRGTCEYFGVESRVPIRIGTLSKALGGIGGFVAGSRPLIDWLTNRARPYVFSTAAPPATAAAALAALEIVQKEPHRRHDLLNRSNLLRRQLADQGWNVGLSAGQIIPIVVGDAERAVTMSATLHDRGFFVPAIRPPTVPEGEACLRVSLTAGHTEEMLQSLLTTLASYRSQTTL